MHWDFIYPLHQMVRATENALKTTHFLPKKVGIKIKCSNINRLRKIVAGSIPDAYI